MNILIVDDNKNNRMILRFLIEEYATTHNVQLSTQEVDDGLKAVEACKVTPFELILMDIMMPNMDGIEATKTIRGFDSKAMIVAISAVDDNERKKIILQSGAEDYIAKPIVGDLFNARLANYLTLIASRNKTVRQEYKVYNLYGVQVGSYHIHFFARNEDAFSEFWEYYLLKEYTSDGLVDMVRFIFALGLELLLHGNKLNIFVEENPQTLFMNLISDVPLDIDETLRFAEKNSFMEYKLKGNTLTTRLDKIAPTPSMELQTHAIKPKDEPAISALVEQINSSDAPMVSSKKLEVFDVLDSYDRVELEDHIGKLNSIVLLMSGANLEPEETDDLLEAMSSIASVLNQYTHFYALAMALNELIRTIEDHKMIFMERSSSMATLAKAFAGDLSRWFQSLFITGAPSINFLDDSIISNAQMIRSFIEPQASASAENLDDIFDF